MICKDCIVDLSHQFESKKHLIHDEFKVFVQSIIEYSKKGTLKESCRFIGHCCIIDGKCKDIIKSSQSFRKRAIIGTPSNLKKSFGGSFCLPEFYLLIKNDDTCMDVFSLGAEENLNARLHFVVSDECANNIMNNNICPNVIMPPSWTSDIINIRINNPHSLNGKMLSFNVKIHTVPKSYDASTDVKGSNIVSPEFVMKSYLYESNGEEHDVTVIVGYDNQSSVNGSLLLYRFHKMKSMFSRGKTEGI